MFFAEKNKLGQQEKVSLPLNLKEKEKQESSFA